MNEDFAFRYSTRSAPEGKALTWDEMEERYLKQLREKDGKCDQSLANLAKLYAPTRRHDEAMRCIEPLIALSDDPEKHAAYHQVLGANMERLGDFQGAEKQRRR